MQHFVCILLTADHQGALQLPSTSFYCTSTPMMRFLGSKVSWNWWGGFRRIGGWLKHTHTHTHTHTSVAWMVVKATRETKWMKAKCKGGRRREVCVCVCVSQLQSLSNRVSLFVTLTDFIVWICNYIVFVAHLHLVLSEYILIILLN